ncbi:MAG: hypothetical protein ABH956_03170 [Candidatus Nealsonbacteria bacterium]
MKIQGIKRGMLCICTKGFDLELCLVIKKYYNGLVVVSFIDCIWPVHPKDLIPIFRFRGERKTLKEVLKNSKIRVFLRTKILKFSKKLKKPCSLI